MEELKKLVAEMHEYSRKDDSESTEFETHFRKIATHLMNNLVINSAGKHYRIVECEFYYNDGKNHQDPFIYNQEENTKYYGQDQQSFLLRWFFHNAGIDLTIGDGNIRGGILIRGVEQNNDELYFRPFNLAYKTFLNTSDYSDDDGYYLKLIEFAHESNEFPSSTIRIGLQIKAKSLMSSSDSNKQKLATEYYSRQYRFLLQSYLRDEKYRKFNDYNLNIANRYTNDSPNSD